MGSRSFGDQSVFNIKRTGTTQSASVPLKLSAQAPRCVNGLSPGKLPYNGMSYRGTVCDSAKNKEKFLTLEKHHKTRPSKMEIYHRDHWVKIVHLAPQNNLTKGNDENTAIGWISHIGRIIKRMHPVTPAIAPKARRPWLHEIYFRA